MFQVIVLFRGLRLVTSGATGVDCDDSGPPFPDDDDGDVTPGQNQGQGP